MGLVFGRLWRKKTTEEVLERLDKEIRTIEEYRKNTELAHKKIVGRFVVISVGVYLLLACIFYFYFFPATFYDQLFYIIPLMLAPVIILTVKRVLTWYYSWKISRKQSRLSTLKDEKKKLLEKVMETETYKVAKSILEKFSEPVIRKTSNLPSETPRKPLPPALSSTAGLRYRPSPSTFQTPARPPLAIAPSTVKQDTQTPLPALPAPAIRTPLPFPRQILPRERSVFDKMVDYLVGDGPANRYALICKNCSSHNGMAMREEFEYISFRCCYCFTFNPARKQRPAAPKLEIDAKAAANLSDTSESEKNSPSDTDSDSDTAQRLQAKEETKDLDMLHSEVEVSEEMEKRDDLPEQKEKGEEGEQAKEEEKDEEDQQGDVNAASD